ncbi:MAG: response regulator, partial [Conexibacter sp.]|nr:response regulator [Conexibacter sp.]
MKRSRLLAASVVSDPRQAPSPVAAGDPLLLLDAVAQPFALADLRGRIVALNAAARTTFGWQRGWSLDERLSIPARESGGDAAELARLLHGEGALLGRTLEADAHHRDGHRIPIQLTVTLLDGAQEPCLAVSMADMTERERARAALDQAQSRTADAFAASGVGVAVVGLDGRFLEVNPALCRLLDRDEESLLRCSFQELTHPDDLELDLEQLRSTLAGVLDRYHLAKRYLRADGGIVWAMLTVTIVRDRDGRPRHFVSQVQDITDRKTSEDELRRYTAQLATLVDTDPLTGLANRRALTAAIEAAQRGAEDEPWSLAGAQLDGDGTTLVAGTQRLAEALAGRGLLAHLGGGE